MNIEKIEIKPNQYVWVDKDVEIKEGDYFYQLNSNTIIKRHKLNGLLLQPQYFDKKIIAASPELNLEGVPNANSTEEAIAWDVILNQSNLHSDLERVIAVTAFVEGYKERDKELPTWDDVRKAIEMAKETTNINPSDNDNMWVDEYSEEQIIEYLKKSKK